MGLIVNVNVVGGYVYMCMCVFYVYVCVSVSGINS